MAISLQDLDQLFAYEPTSHTIGSLPTVREPSPAAARNAAFGIGAVGNGMAKPVAPTSMPSIGAPSAPDLSRPATMPSIAHTLAGNPAGDVVAPQGISAVPQIQKPQTAWQKIEHGLNVAGNIAGNALDPGLMATIPGTELNKKVEQSREARLAGSAADTALKNAEAGGWSNMVTVSDPTTGQQITLPERFAGAIEGKALSTEGAEKRTEEQQAGAGQRTAAQQAGANARTAATQAGEAAREQPKTVAMYDKDPKEGGQLYEYAYDPQTKQFIKQNPAPPTMASLGIFGSQAPLIDPNTNQIVGSYNTKTFAMSPLSGGNQAALSQMTGGNGAPMTTQTARLQNTKQNQFNTQYVNPANQAEQQYQRATEAVNAYNNDPKTGAAAMVLFAQHLGTTLGGIKGAAIGEGAQRMHQDAIGLADRAQRFVDYLKTGQPLSANQVHDFYSLISQTRQLQWETTAREAARRQMPIDFLPQDVSIRMTSPDGKESTEVPAARVQEFVSKGGKIGY